MKNIIFLMTDQHRLDSISYAGKNKISTPNIDRIAETVGFTGCQSVDPVCTPTRTAILTGRYAHQIGTLKMSGDLSLEIPTYPQALQRAGYHTAGIGKFHFLQTWKWGTPRGKGVNLFEIEEDMKKYGFDYIWEASGKQLAVQNYCHYTKYLDELGLLNEYRDFVDSAGKNSNFINNIDINNTNGDVWPFEEKHHVDIKIADEVISQIIERPVDKPLFVFGSFCSPHKPFDPPQRYLDMIPETKLDLLPFDEDVSDKVIEKLTKMNRSYLATIKLVDDQVGRILDTLESEGILDETVILFTTDHGEMGGDHGRKQKSSFYKESINIPCAIRHPDYLNKKIISSPIEVTDLTATMLEIAGLDVDELKLNWPAFNNIIPSRSLMPIVSGESTKIRDFAFSECYGDWQAIIDDHYKYVKMLHYDKPGEYKELLFDLKNDPDELIDISNTVKGQELIQKYRDQKDFILDKTPACQTSWAPLMN